MARLHILDRSENNTYTVVVHSPVPATNNSAGNSWASVLVSAGRNVSSLAIGAGPGQITQAELDQIVGGTVLETLFHWQNNPGWTNNQRVADLNSRAGQAVADAQAELADRYKYYGYTVT